MANNSTTHDAEKIFGNGTWSYDDAFNTSRTPTSAVPPDAKPFETVILVAIVLGILLVTLLLFSLAVLIDCRHQRLEAENSPPKRISPKKSRIPAFIANANANNDELAFVNEMCNDNRVTACVTSEEDTG